MDAEAAAIERNRSISPEAVRELLEAEGSLHRTEFGRRLCRVVAGENGESNDAPAL